MSERVILVDCDGVLADFTGRVVEWINTQRYQEWGLRQKMGISEPEPEKITVDQVTSYKIFTALGLQQLEKKFWTEISSTPGWCTNLNMLPHAEDLIAMLRSIGRVVCVTSPISGLHWAGERREWLIKHLGFRWKDIVLASDKELVSGAVLIDDDADHVRSRVAGGRKAVLWDQPWNRSDRQGTFAVASSVNELAYWMRRTPWQG